MSHGRIISIFGGRFPGEKAAAIFEDLNARSFAARGCEVIVLAPRRFGRSDSVASPYRTVYLLTIDLSAVPLVWSVANYIHMFVFGLSTLVWLLRHSRHSDTILSNESFPLLLATLVRGRTVYEMHDFPTGLIHHAMLRRVHRVIVTNAWKQRALHARFKIDTSKIILERNAFDPGQFGATARDDARRTLGIPDDQTIIVYTGHLYAWKGVHTLAAAAANVPGDIIFVGGTPHDLDSFSKQWATVPNIRMIGHVTQERVALWQAAADVLVLPNSGRDELSAQYTSPMKLFEYMASGRPIVATDVPAIREVLPEDAGYYARPDDAADLSHAIMTALNDPSSGARAARARALVSEYTWEKRAARLLEQFTA